jgi:23S rRNA (guanosine2251-2'-O)-methyltransferase
MLIYGKNPVFEAVKVGVARKIFIRRGTALYNTTFSLPVEILGKSDFDSRFSVDSQGLAADVDEPETAMFDDTDIMSDRIIIVDRIMDPRNLGAIIRSAHCFGVDTVIIPKYHQSPITAVSIKASAGAVFYMKTFIAVNLGRAVQTLQSKGYTIIAADMKAALPVNNFQAPLKSALIIGSEGKGVKNSIISIADIALSIPVCGRIDSLNAAQAAAVILYQLYSSYERI